MPIEKDKLAKLVDAGYKVLNIKEDAGKAIQKVAEAAKKVTATVPEKTGRYVPKE